MKPLLPSLFGLSAAVVLTTLSLAHAGDTPPAAAPAVRLGNLTCPVRGTPVDPKITRVWEGTEIGFCCNECPDKFLANPQAYVPALLKDLAGQLADAKARLAKLEPAAPAPTKPAAPAAPAVQLPIDLKNPLCPVMGRPTDPETTTTYHGMKIRLCCPGCDRKFQADPNAYLQKMRAADADVARRIDEAEAAWNAAHAK